MSHIQYTIYRSGTYYYNRRVPKHAVKAYGSFIRHALSKCPDETIKYANRLTNVLESSWCSRKQIIPIDIPTIIESFKPRSSRLSEMANEYLSLRQIDEVPPRMALKVFMSLAGDRDVKEYTREDAKVFVHHLTLKGNKTATIRRRINSLSAIINYAYHELDLEKRNPFSRLIIPNEGSDFKKRGTFSNEQLRWGYMEAIRSQNTIKLLMPLLGETGCRLSEIVGLELEDIDMKQEIIHIRPNSIRTLKTRNSKRTLPLVGYAKLAMKLVLYNANEQYLFPRYIKGGKCKADFASAALNSWLKKTFNCLTGHCLRHTMRDRLRAIECPLELIDQIGGWNLVSSAGARYGNGYSLAILAQTLSKVQI